MKIEIKTNLKILQPLAGDLEPGDVFIRNRNQSRPLSDRTVYMVMWPHTRLERFTSTSRGVPTVSLHSGRLGSVKNCQEILKLTGNVEMEIDDGS